MISLLARLYGQIAVTRNFFYEKGWFRSFSLGVPTVSIGNITTGGTGKTPLVAFAARVLAEEGRRVGVLTRGYGRENPRSRVLVSDGENILAEPRTAGDEPIELARQLLGKSIIIIADPDRVGAGLWAREEFGIDAFVLDDAFQHRRVRRDLDIVTIDATNPFGHATGILREPRRSLRRADLIVITRANLVEEISDLRSQISEINPGAAIIVSGNEISDFRSQSSDETVSRDDLQHLLNGKALAFCGLGNPDNFFEQLRREGVDLAAAEKFPDHHFYTQKDIKKLEQKAAATKAECLITTAKDAVKLKNLTFRLPCLIAENKLRFDNEKALRQILRQIL